MKPYSPDTNKGRTISGDDVHHKSADTTPSWRKAKARSLRKAARRTATTINNSAERGAERSQ